MATTKAFSLHSVADVKMTLGYLRDPDRDSHKGYAIHSRDSGGDSEFIAEVERLVTALNSETDIAHAVRVRAHWIFVNFPDGSHLSETERWTVADNFKLGLNAAWSREAWHVHPSSGAADYNLILPNVERGFLPTLRRMTVQSLWFICRGILERTVKLLNAHREKVGRTPLTLVDDVQLRKATIGGEPLSLALARVADKQSIPITAETLPALVQQLPNSSDCCIRGRYLLLRRRKKKSQRVKVDALIAAAAAISRVEMRLSFSPSMEHSPAEPDI